MTSGETMSRAGHWLTASLRAAGAVLILIAIAAVLATIFGWGDELMREPSFAAGSIAAAVALGLTMIYAAGDPRRQFLTLIVAAALAVIALLAVAILVAGQSGELRIAGGTVSDEAILISIAILAGVPAALLVLLVRASRATIGPFIPGAVSMPASPDEPGGTAEQELTGVETLTRAVVGVLGGLLVLDAVAIAVLPFLASADQFARQPPLVAASAGGAICLALICLAIAAEPRARLTLIAIPIAAAATGALTQAIQAISLDLGREVELLGGRPTTGLLVLGGLGLTLIAAVGLFVLYHLTWRARYGLRFLWPVAHRGLLAIADVLLDPQQRQASPEHIANGVEAFLVGFKAHRRWLYRVALMTLQLGTAVEISPRPRINPPLLELERAQRQRFLEDHFRRLPNQPGLRFIKHLRQITIRIGQQLVYAGYYGDQASYDSIGYQPFTKRERFRDLDVTEPGEHPLEVELPSAVDPAELSADVVIVGTGAGGSIMAYELARQGHEVLMLERGDYVQPREFSENEIEMIGRLYSDGLMQQTEDWRFTILQGSSVGGSTTVNNAVCFAPPDPVLARWNDPSGADAGLDLDRLHRSVGAIEDFLNIHRQSEAVLNPGAGPFVEGARRLGLTPDELELDVVRANVQGCFGSGYCNMGCRWGKKLSMLDTTLPWAQRDFPGKVRIVAECEVEKILTRDRDPIVVTGLKATLGGHREVTIRARDRYILSAGAIASSFLMQRSGVGRGLPVGARFSANMGAPMMAEFETPQRSFDGLQISHYGRPRNDGYVFETWFNPPAAQALNMAGWFGDHFQNMSRYDHLMAVGVLVGTENNGKVGRALTGGAGIDFRPIDRDLQTLARGLRQLGEILFAGGAKRVMLNTWGADEYTSPDQLTDIDRVCADPDYIGLGTGHPQGGNAISLDPSRGVVGPDFRVHGHANLYVCDASVFPTSLTVNPQLTVMSLAHYAAQSIGDREL